MTTMLSRRDLFGVLAAVGLTPSLAVREAEALAASTRLGTAKPFSFTRLIAAARERASLPYGPESPRAAKSSTSRSLTDTGSGTNSPSSSTALATSLSR